MAILTPFSPEDADWVIHRHAALYAAEEGYDDTFGALVSEIVAEFQRARRDGHDMGWIARTGGMRLGCVFVVREDAETARLRLFLVEPEARGTGLAQRLIDEALRFARSAGYRRMILWTHESHVAAGRLYARNGFILEKSWPETTFGRDVISQVWTRDL